MALRHHSFGSIDDSISANSGRVLRDMEVITMRKVISYPLLCAALLVTAPLLAGKDNQTPSGTDHIDVIAHIPLSGGPVVQLTSGTHWRRDYLYLGHGTVNAVTVLDVT